MGKNRQIRKIRFAKTGFKLKRAAIKIMPYVLVLLCLSLCAFGQEETVQFDGKRAFEMLKAQCAFGPRVPGSLPNAQCADYIESKLCNLGLTVKRQKFNAQTPYSNGIVAGNNIIGIYSGDNPTSDLIALSAHWDTRPVADKEPEPSLRSKPIIGANDGASGVALLIEIARVLKERKYPGRLLFLFFDLEDGGNAGSNNGWCLGSQYFAEHSLGDYDIKAGINFDMIGDRELLIRPELISMKYAADLNKEFFELAKKRAPYQFSNKPYETPILDDHAPFNKKGIPWINIIDFDYPFWHTHEDTPDKCSPISLEIVGNIAVEFIFQRWGKIKKTLDIKEGHEVIKKSSR